MPGRFYQDPLVRDLAWAGFSPLLIKGPGLTGAELPLSEEWHARLDRLDRDPSELKAFLGDTHAGRLGLYYERLWHYLLEKDPDTRLIAHNLRVQDGHRTVGEFDCIYWCRRREAHVHLELAVKFYLGVPGTDTWLGPGQHDRLDQKLQHLLDHQSRLSEHPAAQATLRQYGIESCISLVDIKGYLFAPAAGVTTPEYHNPGNPLCDWYRVEEFTALGALPDDWAGWAEIPRHRWLAPYAIDDNRVSDQNALIDTLAKRLHPGSRPVQMAACDALGREQRRCFVTPNDWPGEGVHG